MEGTGKGSGGGKNGEEGKRGEKRGGFQWTRPSLGRN